MYGKVVKGYRRFCHRVLIFSSLHHSLSHARAIQPKHSHQSNPMILAPINKSVDKMTIMIV